jgi:hypothetical protein
MFDTPIHYYCTLGYKYFEKQREPDSQSKGIYTSKSKIDWVPVFPSEYSESMFDTSPSLMRGRDITPFSEDVHH